jgi:hypothetical protein
MFECVSSVPSVRRGHLHIRNAGQLTRLACCWACRITLALTPPPRLARVSGSMEARAMRAHRRFVPIVSAAHHCGRLCICFPGNRPRKILVPSAINDVGAILTYSAQLVLNDFIAGSEQRRLDGPDTLLPYSLRRRFACLIQHRFEHASKP